MYSKLVPGWSKQFQDLLPHKSQTLKRIKLDGAATIGSFTATVLAEREVFGFVCVQFLDVVTAEKL